MDISELAVSELGSLVAFDQDPELSTDDLEAILTSQAVVDANGLMPSELGWEPTFDLAAAAVEGWRRKAGKAAGRFNFADDNQRFDRAQTHRHCMAMVEEYKTRVGLTLRTPRESC